MTDRSVTPERGYFSVPESHNGKRNRRSSTVSLSVHKRNKLNNPFTEALEKIMCTCFVNDLIASIRILSIAPMLPI